jgi:hypothetical protein
MEFDAKCITPYTQTLMDLPPMPMRPDIKPRVQKLYNITHVQ